MDDDATREEELRYSIEYAYENSPYYRSLFDENGISPEDIQTVDDLVKIPITSGEDIIQNQPPNTREFRFATDAKLRRPIQSTGTRKTPKSVLLSPDDWDLQYKDTGTFYREAVGISPDDTVATYLPYIGFNISGPATNEALKEIGATEIPFATTPYPPHVEEKLLRQYNPNVMVTAASGAYRKGKKFQNNGIDPSSLGFEKIAVGGEPVSLSRKRRIEEMFDATVFELYASTEASMSGYSCPENPSVMHHINDHSYMQVVDEDGEPVEEGESGRIVFTRLLPLGAESKMPIIRYAVGDRTTVVEDPGCECDAGYELSFEPPVRESHQVSVGPADLNHQEFAEFLYADDYYQGRVGESLLEVDHNDETGQHVLTFRFERLDPELKVGEVTSISGNGDAENEIEAFGQRLLDNLQNLRGYVDQQDYIQFNVSVVDEIEQPRGKPIRVIRNQS